MEQKLTPYRRRRGLRRRANRAAVGLASATSLGPDDRARSESRSQVPQVVHLLRREVRVGSQRERVLDDAV